MSIQMAHVTITGINPLLQNNPQCVDPFNRFTKLKKPLTSKKQKTEEDLLEIGNIETESKIYFDEKLGVYVPTRWITEQIVTSSFGITKIGKDRMRGGLFATEGKAKLTYRGIKNVSTINDIVFNADFRHRMVLPQQNVRIAKDFPIFHDWEFSTILEFDDSVVDLPGLTSIITRGARYVGFGDFRPTFGRGTAEVKGV
jgi:hypothetical protein